MKRIPEKCRAETIHLKLAIVGGGRACRFFLDLLRESSFPYLDIEVVGVCDINPNAEGYRLAQEMGIYTTEDFHDLFNLTGLNGILELTNNRDVLLELIRLRPKSIGILEHNISRLLRRMFVMDHGLEAAEQRVALEREASRFLIQQANERIVVLSPDFEIIEANESFLTAVGKSLKEVIGARCYAVTHGQDEPCSRDHPAMGCPLLETLRSGESAHVLHEHPSRGGTPTYCDMVTYPIKDETGKVARVIEIWRDVTEVISWHLEKHLSAVKKDVNKLIQEDRMISLGKLVASSVHEINNPIQGLLTFSRLMLDMLAGGPLSTKDQADFKKYLSIMADELERCGNIVSGLLSFSRRPKVQYKKVDLNEVLNQVLTLTRHRMEIQGIAVHTRFNKIALVIEGEENQLQQCFLNVVFNAIEAMVEGGRLEIESSLDRGMKAAVVRILDAGPGIKEEDLDHIFDPFFTTKPEGQGTGMGLSIVYGIVKNHKGTVEVETELGKGTVFTLKFPLPEAADLLTGSGPEEHGRGVSGPSSASGSREGGGAWRKN